MRHSSHNVKFSYAHAKLLTLFAFLIVIYWEDLEEFSRLIVVDNRVYAVLAALGILGIYMLPKSGIINKILKIGSPNAKMGIMFFTFSVIIYLAGSYSAAKLFHHTVSLVLLTASYLMIRVNSLTVRIFLPILITMLILPLLPTSEPFKTVVSVLLLTTFASSIILLADLSFDLKVLLTATNAFLYTLMKAASLPDQVLLILACSEVLVMWLALRRRPVSNLKDESHNWVNRGACPICGSGKVTEDFCPFCGRILVRETPRSRLEVFGIILFIIFLVSVFISIPILVEREEGVTLTYLRVQGPVQRAISFNSYDWLLCDRYVLNGSEQELRESFVFKEVLVPELLPETKNYTIVFELAP